KDRFSNSSILSFFFELMERWAMKLSNQSFFLSYDDLTYAITHYKIPKNKTLWTPFGTFSSFDRKANANKSKLATKYGLNTSKKWIYFVGSMDFPPNVEAVAWILHNLAPSKDIKDCFEILIVGAYLPERYLRKIKELEHVHYLGYIEDLLTLIDSCDIMINPICSGAGIKTKLVQALALHKFCVSTSIGALGLIDSHNLKREDTASGFIEALLAYEQPKNTEKTFFDLYHYEAIVSKIIQSWK
ncbi:MAG: glycosyltransferase family 4 protein, partial [Chitinophagales bacterium]|nr:glycosyltransferase family 4 protein [Chitinophagales bacterium]